LHPYQSCGNPPPEIQCQAGSQKKLQVRAMEGVRELHAATPAIRLMVVNTLSHFGGH
jgi:hypothetical protein